MTLLAPIPWAQRVWALPFLTALAPSERFARERRHRHKKLTDRARQLLILLARWLPERQLVAVADSSYFSDALAVVRYHLWTAAISSDSADHADLAKISRALLDRLTQAACLPA